MPVKRAQSDHFSDQQAKKNTHVGEEAQKKSEIHKRFCVSVLQKTGGISLIINLNLFRYIMQVS